MNRATGPPAVLTSLGHPACQDLCALAERAEANKITFSPSIYRHTEVLEALIECHHGKCCLCEQHVQEDGDVEHFRPKARYYWLAYDWNNLLLSCSACNSRHKRNLFPLRDESSRVSSHLENISREDPLFIDPCREDPEESIEWQEEHPRPRRGNRRARVTLDALRLNERGLPTTRRIRLNEVERIEDVLLIARKMGYVDVIPGIVAWLNQAQDSSSVFAGMVRAYLKNAKM